MRMLDIIIKKRNKQPLTLEEFTFISNGAAKGTLPDYQLSSFLMACFLNPLSKQETAFFTKAMALSGQKLEFKNSKIPVADKHSTGGVGDGISLALAPLVAAAGVAVPMMSGRGLGHTGGTLDKLESMKGFNISTPTKQIYKQIQQIGVCMFGQTKDLAPADKKLYALRDACGCVESRPLITASILSKKYAEGIDNLFIDVKFGSGAFMQKYEDSKKLAKMLVETAKLMGLNCRALITDMNEPLGRAIGNANEMLQSILILKGDKEIAPDFYEILLESAAQMLLITKKQKDIKKAKTLLEKLIKDGSALKKFKEILKWQGADTKIADEPQKYLKDAKYRKDFTASSKGYIANIDARLCGMAAVLLGAGRGKMEDKIDYGAGIWLDKKSGDQVAKGQVIARLYADDKKKLEEGFALFGKAVKISSKKPSKRKLIREIIR